VLANGFQDTTARAATAYSYQVKAVNSVGPSGPSNTAAATTPTFFSQDIAATPGGSTAVVAEGSAYDVVAGGPNIYNNADGFRFAWQKVTGDFDVRAQVAGFTGSVAAAKAGLMARVSLDANSVNFFATSTVADGFRFSRRTTTGGSTVFTKVGAPSYPNAWVRLQRVGNKFTALHSSNGVNWTTTGSLTQTVPATLFFGMAVSSNSTTETAAAQFRNVGPVGAVVPQPPSVPLNLSADATSATQIELAWQASTGAGPITYRLERKGPSDVDFVAVPGAGALSATAFVDAGREPGTRYDYRVRAQNGVGPSGYSNVAFDTTPVLDAPAAPGNLQARADLPTEVVLTWDASADATSYRVERMAEGEPGFTEIADNVAGTSFTDRGVQSGTTYTYRVRAQNAEGVSGYSNTDGATTPQSGAFISADIGANLAGSTSVVNEGSDYDVSAGGPNIFNNADGFRFVYKPVTGNFDLRVRVNSLTGDNPAAKAGIMARDGLAAGARNAFASATSGAEFRLSRRTTANGATGLTKLGAVSYPNAWVRLRRSGGTGGAAGNTFTAYFSTDGMAWTTITSASITMPATLMVGMATTSGSASTTVPAVAQYRSFGNTVFGVQSGPSAPGTLTAAASGPSTIDLAWGAAAGATTYAVERRSATGEFFEEIASGLTGTTFVDTGREAGTTYVYHVRGFDDSGAAGVFGNEAEATTPEA
jgi:hypothetical protein